MHLEKRTFHSESWDFVFAEIFNYEIDFFVVRGVTDTAHHWSAVSLTLLTRVVDPELFDWIQIYTPKNPVPDPTSI
jgi:hypothetical protein